MDIEEIRGYALSKIGAEESFPFGGDTLVFKVGGKMFLLAGLDSYPLFINLKQNPEKSLELRLQYPEVHPAWHMDKKHWNSIFCEGLRREFIFGQIDDSYNLVFNSLTKKLQKEILENQ